VLGAVTKATMNRDDALQELTTAYAVAIRLRDGGADHTMIGRALAVPPQAVEGLLRLADSKLATLLDADAEPSV
jgi:hypothetical protein